MRKSILLAILLFLMSMTVFAAEPRFDHMRSVLIVNTTQQDEVTNYMTHRLMQPFRIPYWDRLQTEDCLSPQDVTKDTLRTLANTYHADVVLVPVVHTWRWRQYTLFFHYDDELITEYAYSLRSMRMTAKKELSTVIVPAVLTVSLRLFLIIPMIFFQKRWIKSWKNYRTNEFPQTSKACTTL